MPDSASVLICTARKEPRLIQTLECLKNQSFKNFELIYIDALKPQREPEFLETIKSYEQHYPIVHIQDRPRPKLGEFPGICNARNSGIIMANGDAILMVGDHTYLPENWITRHMFAYSKGFNSTGPCWMLKTSDELYKYKTGTLEKHPEENKIFVKFGETKYESPYDCRLPGIPDEYIFSNKIIFTNCGGGWMHSLNLQMSLERLLNINGFSEEFDKAGWGFEDCHLGARMQMMGFPQIFDVGNWMLQIDDKLNTRMITGSVNPEDRDNFDKYGAVNSKLYDDFLQKGYPIWSNPEINLRKMREVLRIKS